MQILVANTVTIFFLMDFIGTIPVFLSLTANRPTKERVRIALFSSWIAGIIVFGFAFLGQVILQHFGISISALRVGGGLLLLYIAFEMIFAGQSMYSNPVDSRDIIVSPLAIPMLAGPGSMSFAMISYANAQRSEKLLSLLAVILATFLGAVILSLSGILSKYLNKEIVRAIEKITAILLAVIAAQMILGGIQTYFFH